MRIFIIILIGIVYPFLGSEKNRNYVGHIQYCSGAYAVDRTWNLKLKEKGTYLFKIENVDTKNFIDVRLKSEYSGNWTTKNDTLFLYNDRVSMELFDSVFLYRMKDSILFSLGNYVDSSWGLNYNNKAIMKLKVQP